MSQQVKQIFQDRKDAGRVLAVALQSRLTTDPQRVVLALPRGGVAVGFEVAQRLSAPFDVCIVRDIGGARK